MQICVSDGPATVRPHGFGTEDVTSNSEMQVCIKLKFVGLMLPSQIGATHVFSYAQAETILARMHEAQTAQRGAFRGRLQNLRRFKIPIGISPGTGARVSYTREHIFQWAICLELFESGIDPSLTARFIHAFWHLFKHYGYYTPIKNDEDDDVIFVIYPAIMSKAWFTAQESDLFRSDFPDFVEFKTGQISDASLLIAGLRGKHRRAMFINLTDVLRQIDIESRKLGIDIDAAIPPQSQRRDLT